MLLSLRQLVLVRGERALCTPFDLGLNSGQLAVIKGHNGSGKSTLLRLIAGLSSAEAAHGERHQPLPSECLYWGHALGLKAELTASENLADLCLPKTPSAPVRQASLSTMGLHAKADWPTRYLSAGQKRRILLARLALSEAKLLLLDEVTTALDQAGIDLLISLIKAHLARGGAALVVSHDTTFDALGQIITLTSPQAQP